MDDPILLPPNPGLSSCEEKGGNRGENRKTGDSHDKFLSRGREGIEELRAFYDESVKTDGFATVERIEYR
jgi:hypothetical protein